MIRFDHVSKKFSGEQVALSDISMEIADGEFVFLIGPSGAGKSTILRMILRDVLPSSGTIQVNEWDVASIPKKRVHMLRRAVGMVFQDFKLLSDRTIGENVALGLDVLGKHGAEAQKGVADVLELVGLSKKASSFPAQLAAGEKQRAAIARAIVGGPKILLADEPTGNLDPDTGWDILEILQEINSMGTTVIMATHNNQFVNNLKKRTITIRAGALETDEEKGRYRVSGKSRHSHKDDDDEEDGHAHSGGKKEKKS